MFSDNYTQDTALARAGVLDEERATVDQLAQASRSEEARVRVVAARHARTPLLSLLKLSDDEATSVRAALAGNPRTDVPEDVWDRLAHDKQVDVLLALAGNTAIPAAVLRRLALHRDRDVASAARHQYAKQGGVKGVLAKLTGG